MSTSSLYHASGLKLVKYISTQYINGGVIFRAEVTGSIQRCPDCNSLKTHRKKETRFLLLKNYKTLDEEKQGRLQSLLEVSAPLFTIHTMKEELRQKKLHRRSHHVPACMVQGS